MLDFVRREVPPKGTAVTDLWWLDQVAASATDGRTILFIADTETGTDAIGQLAEAGTANVTLISSREDEVQFVEGLATLCYTTSSVRQIPERGLVAVQLTRLDTARPCVPVAGSSASEPVPRP